MQGSSPSESPRASGGEVTLAIPQNRSYGAIGGVEKVTYTWADINAFATEDRSRNRKFWNFWRGSSDRMFQQRKQLLKNGNFMFIYFLYSLPCCITLLFTVLLFILSQ